MPPTRIPTIPRSHPRTTSPAPRVNCIGRPRLSSNMKNSPSASFVCPEYFTVSKSPERAGRPRPTLKSTAFSPSPRSSSDRPPRASLPGARAVGAAAAGAGAAAGVVAGGGAVAARVRRRVAARAGGGAVAARAAAATRARPSPRQRRHRRRSAPLPRARSSRRRAACSRPRRRARRARPPRQTSRAAGSTPARLPRAGRASSRAGWRARGSAAPSCRARRRRPRAPPAGSTRGSATTTGLPGTSWVPPRAARRRADRRHRRSLAPLRLRPLQLPLPVRLFRQCVVARAPRCIAPLVRDRALLPRALQASRERAPRTRRRCDSLPALGLPLEEVAREERAQPFRPHESRSRPTRGPGAASWPLRQSSCPRVRRREVLGELTQVANSRSPTPRRAPLACACACIRSSRCRRTTRTTTRRTTA